MTATPALFIHGAFSNPGHFAGWKPPDDEAEG